MSNVAILTDSNSGITQSEARELGIHVIPMPFNIDGTEYFEDISLSQEGFYEYLKADASVATSQPSITTIMDTFDELLTSYDQVVYIPMSSGLSGSYQSANMVAREFDDRVFVVNNQRISVTQRASVMDALELVKRDKDGAFIRDFLEKEKFNSTIYITLDTLHYLKKGGRVTPAAAALGAVLKIKPVLQIQGEKLDAFSKARTPKVAKQTMIDAIKKDIEGRISEDGKYKYVLSIAHTQNEDMALALRDELLEIFDIEDILINPLSLSVSCHIGPGALAIAASRIPDYDS